MLAEAKLAFLHRGSYDKGRDGEALTWSSGQPIEFADLYDVDETTSRRVTISPELAGTLPTKIGDLFRGVLRVSVFNGKTKLQLVAVKPLG